MDEFKTDRGKFLGIRRGRRVLLLIPAMVGVMLITRGVHIQVKLQPPPAAHSQEAKAPPSKLKEISDEYAQLAEDVMPSVVSIDGVKVIPGMPGRDVFQQQQFEGSFNTPEQRIATGGSGVIIRKDGYIVTNHHVIDGVREIRVTYADKTVAPAKLVGSDATSDLAVIKVEGDNLHALPFGESKKMRIGEFVLAFGSPLGMQGSVSHGIVSGKDRKNLGLTDYEDYIQTDAAINPGNSGGPLVNLDGELIGINAALLSKSGGSQGLGFAIPAEVVKQVVDELIAHGRVERSWLGMFVKPMQAEWAQQLGLSDARGVLVDHGYRDAPAGKSGFHRYDVILQVDGTSIQDDRELRRILAQIPVGQVVDFRIWRERRPAEIKVKTEVRPMNAQGQPAGGI